MERNPKITLIDIRLSAHSSVLNDVSTPLLGRPVISLFPPPSGITIPPPNYNPSASHPNPAHTLPLKRRARRGSSASLAQRRYRGNAFLAPQECADRGGRGKRIARRRHVQMLEFQEISRYIEPQGPQWQRGNGENRAQAPPVGPGERTNFYYGFRACKKQSPLVESTQA